jgi:outer membrane immunogenic protein
MGNVGMVVDFAAVVAAGVCRNDELEMIPVKRMFRCRGNKSLRRRSSVCRRFAVTAGVLIAFAAQATADELDAAPGMQIEHWTGAYIGAHAGYASLAGASTVRDDIAQSWTQNADGVTGGILVGYNFDMGSFVLGLEADTSFGFVKDTDTRPGLGPVTITDHGQHTFRGRAGMPLGPGLLYATGGLALADVWARSPAGRDKQFLLGFVVGAGFETIVHERLSLRMEYRYASYGEVTYRLAATAMKSDLDSHSVRVGIVWHVW